MAWWQKSGNLSYKDDYGIIYTVSWVKKDASNPGQLLYDFTTTTLGPVWGRPPKVKRQANNQLLVECEQTTTEQLIQVYGNSIPNDYSLTTVSTASEIVYRYLGYNCVNKIKNPFKFGLNNAITGTEEFGVNGPGCWSDPDDPNGVLWNDVGLGDNFWIDIWNN